MFKKIFTLSTLCVAMGSFAFAQDFTMEHESTTETTTGTEDGNLDDYVVIENHLTNISTSTYKYKWNLLAPISVPTGWTLQGFCDNLLCRSTGGPWSTGVVQESADLMPGEESVFKLQVCAPVSASDGSMSIKVRAFTRDQSDTVTYILQKGTLGLNSISLKDERVVLSPNPAVNQVKVFADKSLGAKQITVINMLGRTVLNQDMAAGSEEAVVNLNGVASGMYMVRVSDAKGNVITSRKLTKN